MKRVRAINALLKHPQGSSIYRLFAREYLKGWVLITLHESGRNIFSFRNFSPMTNAPINLSTELPIFTLKIPFSRCFTSETLLLDVTRSQEKLVCRWRFENIASPVRARHFQVEISRDRETCIFTAERTRESQIRRTDCYIDIPVQQSRARLPDSSERDDSWFCWFGFFPRFLAKLFPCKNRIEYIFSLVTWSEVVCWYKTIWGG